MEALAAEIEKMPEGPEKEKRIKAFEKLVEKMTSQMGANFTPMGLVKNTALGMLPGLGGKFGVPWVTNKLTEFLVDKIGFAGFDNDNKKEELNIFMLRELCKGSEHAIKFMTELVAPDKSAEEKKLIEQAIKASNEFKVGLIEQHCDENKILEFVRKELARGSLSSQELVVRNLCDRCGISKENQNLYFQARDTFNRLNPKYTWITNIYDIVNNLTRLLAVTYEITPHGQQEVHKGKLGTVEKIGKIIIVARHLVDSYVKLSHVCKFDYAHTKNKLSDTRTSKLLGLALWALDKLAPAFVTAVDFGRSWINQQQQKAAQQMQRAAKQQGAGGGLPGMMGGGDLNQMMAQLMQ